MVGSIKSLCPFCGCSCSLNFTVDNDRLVKVRPDSSDVCSAGRPCIKGLVCNEVAEKNRVRYPMVRKEGKLVKASWEEAYSAIAKGMGKLKPTETYFIGSGECTNEDNYVLQRMAREIFNTNNIDTSARLCHAATAIAFNRTMGIDFVPNKMDDCKGADVFLIIGSNPASNYPVFFNRIMEEKKKGAKVVTVSIEPNDTSIKADKPVYIEPRGLIAFIGGLIRKIMENKNRDIDGWEKLSKTVNIFSDDYIATACKIEADEFREVAEIVSKAKKIVICHGMGLTQHVNGVQHAIALADLAITLDGIILPLRGKVNIQGSGDVGCSPFSFLGKNLSIKGRMLTDAIFDPYIKAMFIMGMNPAKSLPNLLEVHKKMRNMFIVYMHHHKSTSMKFADVVLPAPLLFECSGTITNGESRVRMTHRAVESPAKKEGWQILCELAKHLDGKNFDYGSSSEIFNEITQKLPKYANLKWDNVENNQESFTDKTISKKVLADFSPELPLELEGSREYPFILTTSRQYNHFNTGESTLCSKSLRKISSQPFCSISSHDAHRIGVKSGDRVLVESIMGGVKIKVKVNNKMKHGIVNIPFHYESVLINTIIPSNNELDPISGTPNYKSIKVKIKKTR